MTQSLALVDRLAAVQPFLIDASERLASAPSIAFAVKARRESARAAIGANGITVVLREGVQSHYVAEDAVAPLWA